MLRSLYSSVAGMKGFQVKLDVIGNNIANVNTIGFKKSRVMFQDLLYQTLPDLPSSGITGGSNPKQVGLGSAVSTIDVLHTPASSMTTGLLLDFSIEGDGFFVVEQPNPDGDAEGIFLTRAGNFQVDANGFLVTGSGYYVLDSLGERIGFPEEAETFRVARDGTVLAFDYQGEPVDFLNGDDEPVTLGVSIPTNPAGLRKAGSNYYVMSTNSHGLDGDGNYINLLTSINEAGSNAQIIQGQLEMSNVDITEEFTEMIVAQRGFQANSRIVSVADEILQEIVNLKR